MSFSFCMLPTSPHPPIVAISFLFHFPKAPSNVTQLYMVAHWSFLVTVTCILCKTIERVSLTMNPKLIFSPFSPVPWKHSLAYSKSQMSHPSGSRSCFLLSITQTEAGSSSHVGGKGLNFMLWSSELDSMHMVKTETICTWMGALEMTLTEKRKAPKTFFASFQHFLEPILTFFLVLLI